MKVFYLELYIITKNNSFYSDTLLIVFFFLSGGMISKLPDSVYKNT